MNRLPLEGFSLRTRLTIWYGVLLAVTLLAFSSLVYFTLERSLTNAVDEALELRSGQIRRTLAGSVGMLVQPEDVAPGEVEPSPLDEFAAPGIYVQVLNARGAVISAPLNLSGGQLPVTSAGMQSIQTGDESLADVPIRDEAGGDVNVRILTEPLRGASGEIVGAVQVGQSLSPVEATMTAVARLLFLAGMAALVIAMLIGWLLTRRALSPVAHVTAMARHIAQTGDYNQRLPVPPARYSRGDELRFLAVTFNDMIARLEQVLESQRRLLADTSHELRNPLTVIRGNLALLCRSSVPPATQGEAVREADEEAVRMSRLVDDLLLLARADAGQLLTAKASRINLVALAREEVERQRATAANRTLQLSVTANQAVFVRGDPDRLRQLLANLIGNAVRYTPDHGSIVTEVALAFGEAQQAAPSGRSLATTDLNRMPGQATHAPSPFNQVATVTISDTGIGLTPEQLSHMFDRFYRANKARPRVPAGAGLGLSIAQHIVQAHGGRISASSPGLGEGASLRIELPAIAEVTQLADAEMPGPDLSVESLAVAHRTRA